MQMNAAMPDCFVYEPFGPSFSVKKDIEACNFDSVNAADQGTQLLLRISMAIDKEIFANEAEFTADMLQLG